MQYQSLIPIETLQNGPPLVDSITLPVLSIPNDLPADPIDLFKLDPAVPPTDLVNFVAHPTDVVFALVLKWGDKLECHKILKSENRAYQLFLPRIHETIYGSIFRGTVLERMGEDREWRGQTLGVYRGTSEGVVIKVFDAQRVAKHQANGHQENLFKEFATLQYLSDERKHVNVLGQLDCLKDERGNYYSIMRFAGTELLDNLISHGALPEIHARALFLQLINGLEHMHELGIAHRDLCASNVLIERLSNDDDTMRLSIIDLGMSVCCQPRDGGQGFHPMPMQYCGKRRYMAPEIVNLELSAWMQSSPYLPFHADRWTIGIVLFVMLTTSVPVNQAWLLDPLFHALATEGLEKAMELQHFVRTDTCFVHLGDPSLRLSFQVVDLLKNILRVEPSERFTFKQMRDHPWFQGIM